MWVRHLFSEELISLVLAATLFVLPAAAATRLQDRSIIMQSSLPSVTTNWTITLQYMSPAAIGSVDMLFCNDPIPQDPCVAPAGLDVSHAALTDQTGEVGFSIDPSSHTASHMLLKRAPGVPTTEVASSYTFSGVVNPSDTSQSFAVRMKDFSSTDGSGPQIDFGSADGHVTNAIVIQAQVPPMLIFCLAQQVGDGCTTTNDTYYTDMGVLDPKITLTAQSQMAAGTNASNGYAITVNGTPMAAGRNYITPLTTPTESTPGTDQFGINLVANQDPQVGMDPSGDWTNAVPSAEYSQPNKYKFSSGDVVASAPHVSLMEKFTVSYVVNSSDNLKPGVYSTTLTFIASGRF